MTTLPRKQVLRSPLSGLAPYPRYVDSGVESLGVLPAHWSLRRLKTVASVELSNVDKKSVEGQVPVLLCNYTHVYGNDRINSGLEFMPATATVDQVRRFSLRAGDVLITKDSESWTDIAVPALVTSSDFTGVLCGYHLALLRPRQECLGPFLARLFAAAGVRHQFEVGATGVTRFGLSGDAIRTGLFPIPPVEEQRAITSFLDRKIATIDALLDRKRRLIELLREKRRAVVSEVVTVGVDRAARTRKTDLPWMMNVPEHWRAIKVKRLFRHTKRPGHAGETVLSVYRDYGVIEKSSRDDNFNRTPEDLDSYQLVLPGDLVINKMKAWQGSLGVAGTRGITSPDYLVYSPEHEEDGRYLHQLLRAHVLADVYRSISNGIRPSQWRLESDRFGELVLFLPPREEQNTICEYLDQVLQPVELLSARAEAAIERLEEFRVALISAAVTGMIDVRNLVAG